MTDIAILALPVHVVWRLQATLMHRLSVIGIFLLGSLFVNLSLYARKTKRKYIQLIYNCASVIFTSIYRFVTLFAFDPSDIAWTLGKSSTWCIVEASTGILCACMPTLRPLFVKLSSKFRSQNGSSRNQTTDTTARAYNMGMPGFRSGVPERRSRSRIQTEVTQTDDGTDDEVPLNSIHVQRDMTWRETRSDSLRD